MDRIEDVRYTPVGHRDTGTHTETDFQHKATFPTASVYDTDENPAICNNATAGRPDTCFTSWTDSWWPEFLGLIGSMAAIVSVAIVLGIYNGKEEPGWPTVSLNTLISWLSTFGRASVLIPISTSIGQLKWTTFARNKHNLSELRAFDEASRGAMGSVRMIWTHNPRYGHKKTAKNKSWRRHIN